ncbi:hypothetical protein EQG49_11035 [Periweissella cryptocerci]|uniref:ImmA/IrrE family metallo-endopeptidase n=1 Tax=Periweissella cryptocerci TaxID=2506420 RepID=A0A4P6YVW6_9LACO|nr:hypothetical protein [Periweissella cryptocerci]QBO36940.1 hypothetical protein EQG49_11035 [Periweissella cryptocerci]
MIEEIYDFLDDLAAKNGIIVYWLSIPEYIPHRSNPHTKKIAMVGRHGRQDLIFPYAHEISHVIFGDPTIDKLYPYSPGAHSSSEMNADAHGLDMLIDWFDKYQDNGIVYSQRYAFMEWFKIPSHLERVVERKLAN